MKYANFACPNRVWDIGLLLTANHDYISFAVMSACPYNCLFSKQSGPRSDCAGRNVCFYHDVAHIYSYLAFFRLLFCFGVNYYALEFLFTPC